MVPDKSILYLVFNKKNQIDAKAEFPENTDVMTTNSFCGNIVRKMFGSKLFSNKNCKIIP